MFGLVNRGELSGKTEHEFEQLNGRLKQFLLVEHNEDGTHIGLDASSIVSGTLHIDRVPVLTIDKVPVLTKAKQHAQTAYKDESNVFTQSQVISHSSAPALILSRGGVNKAQFAYDGLNTFLDADGDFIVRQDFGAGPQMMRVTPGGVLSCTTQVINAPTTPTQQFVAGGATQVNIVGTSGGNLFLHQGGTFFVTNSDATMTRFQVNTNGALQERGRSTPMGEWAAYTPTLTGITIGNGSITANFSQVGKTVHYTILVLMGSTTTFAPATQFGVSMPTAFIASAGSKSLGHWQAFDSSAGQLFAGGTQITTSPTLLLNFPSIVTAGGVQAVSFTAPFTWAQNDQLYVFGTYQEP